MKHHGRARVPWWGVLGAVVAVAAVAGTATALALRGEPAATPVFATVPATGPAVPPVVARGSAAPAPIPSISVEAVFALDAHSVDDPDSPWVIVNKRRSLDPADYAPSDLTSLSTLRGGSGVTMRADAAAALIRMQGDAQSAGAGFAVSSAYRSYATQRSLYNGYVNERGRAVADSFSARPGHSEHQTGLSVDVCSTSPCRLAQSFANEPAGVWIDDHLWEYGFVLRYDWGQEDVTGYIAEPWHLRYVGPDLARHWHEQGRPPLETLFGLPPAPDYR